MGCPAPGPDHASGPAPTVGELARTHGAALLRAHALSEAQRRVLHDISVCRTPVLGGHMDACAQCGFQRAVYHSCRNRHCPACPALAQARWLEQRRERILPTHYFHVVFTIPDTLLGPIALRNRELFFNSMFIAASQTLLALGNDPKRLGAQIGMTCVLHTWTRDLRFHPHLHCIVTGGGLTADGERWISTSQDYLFPVRVLSKLFRGKLIARLEEARRDGRLKLKGLDGFDDPHKSDGAWHRLRDRLYKTAFVSYSKPPFGGADAVYAYLGRYTHRVGISNRRLLTATSDTVTFQTRGDQTATLHPVEFLRRLLLHVLPDRFVRLRHYGLLAPGNVNRRLLLARERSEALRNTSAPQPPTVRAAAVTIDWRALLLLRAGIDVTRCPLCGSALASRPLPPPAARDSS